MKRCYILLVVINLLWATTGAHENSPYKFAIIVTGKELLHGVYADAHTLYITRKLTPLGFKCTGVMIVDDDIESIYQALEFLITKNDLIILTGGLGPGLDDCTADAVSNFTKIPLQEDPLLLQQLATKFQTTPEKLLANIRRQARIPTNGNWLPNRNGTAVGLIFEFQNKWIVALPGPPRELQPMFEHELLPRLLKKYGIHQAITTIKLRFADIGESKVNNILQNQIGLPKELEIISLSDGGRVDIILISNQDGELLNELRRISNSVQDILKDYLYAIGERTLEDVFLETLQKVGKPLVVIESGTMGIINHALNQSQLSTQCLLAGISTPRTATLPCVISGSHSIDSSYTNLPPIEIFKLASKQFGEVIYLIAVERSLQSEGIAKLDISFGPIQGKFYTNSFQFPKNEPQALLRTLTSILNWCRLQLP